MDEGLLLFKGVKPSISEVNEVFAFDTNTLEATDSSKISRYAIILAQYLIYLQSGCNDIKVQVNQKKRFLESAVNQILTKELLKQYDNNKTKAKDIIISETQSLNVVRKELDILQDELILLDGQDKNISELIAVFKRELTRRDNELYMTRRERNG